MFLQYTKKRKYFNQRKTSKETVYSKDNYFVNF